MFGQVGTLEIVVVLVIALIVLGPSRLPEAGRSLGKGIREFKDSISGGDKDDDVERIEIPPSQEGERTSSVRRERDTVL